MLPAGTPGLGGQQTAGAFALKRSVGVPCNVAEKERVFMITTLY